MGPSQLSAKHYISYLHICLAQNWKYITYRNAARGRPSHGHRGYAQKIWQRSVWQFQRYARTQTHTHTDRLITILHSPHRGAVMMIARTKIYRWSAGMASTVFRVPRVDTRFELSEQSHWTCSAQSGCRFSTTAMKPAQFRVK